MYRNTEDKIRDWFKTNFQVHSDWTGDWVEYNQHSSSVEDIANKLIKFLNDKSE